MWVGARGFPQGVRDSSPIVFSQCFLACESCAFRRYLRKVTTSALLPTPLEPSLQCPRDRQPTPLGAPT
eukprot:3525492-Prymnesium_polylepis.1